MEPFFKKFGSTFWEGHLNAVKPTDFDAAAKAFCEIVDLRNRLVHNNYAAFPLEITHDDLFKKFEDGRKVICCVDKFLEALPRS